jgi:hypothetical protein
VTKAKPGSAQMGADGASALVSAIPLLASDADDVPDGLRIAGTGAFRRRPLLRRDSSVWRNGIVVLITNYYTSTAYKPVRKSQGFETGHGHEHHRRSRDRPARDGAAGCVHRLSILSASISPVSTASRSRS